MKNKKVIAISLLLSFVYSALTNFGRVDAIYVNWTDPKGYFTRDTMRTDQATPVLRNCDNNSYDAFRESSFQNTTTGTDKAQSTMKSNFISIVERYYGNGRIDSKKTSCGIYFDATGTAYANSSADYNKIRNAIGARFIMTEITGGDSSLTGNALKTKFENVINDPNLYISYKNYDFSLNSAHGTTTAGDQDVQYENNTQNNIPSLLFYYDTDANGKGDTLVAAIKAFCGNMIANPGSPWLIEPTVTVDKTSVKIGETATWTYKADVLYGPTSKKNAAVVTYQPVLSGSGSVGTIAANSSDTVSVNGTQQVTFTSAGKYCSKLKITYGSGWQRSNGTIIASATVFSEDVCVTVGATPSDDYCRGAKGVSSATLYPILPNTYPFQTNGVVSVSQYGPVEYTVLSSGVGTTWGRYNYSLDQLPDSFTTENTTGDSHTISKQDYTNHVVSLTKNYNAAYVGYWLDNYDPITFAYINTTYTDIADVLTTDPSFSAANYPAGARFDINYSYSYRDTTVRYSDGDTRTLITGYAPQWTNYNGQKYDFTTVGPCYDYTLTTSISGAGGNKEEGNPVRLNSNVSSSSWTAANNSVFYSRYRTHSHSKNIKYYLTKFVLPPGATRPTTKAEGRSTLAPCLYYGYKVCSTETTGTMNVPTSGQGFGYDFTTPEVSPGTVICFAFSVFTHASDPSYWSNTLDSGDYYHSAFSYNTNCLLVVKKPKVQVLSGDLSAGKSSLLNASPSGNIQTSLSTKFGTTYGSWVEYAIYAKGSVRGLASGSALSGGRVSSDCRINLLTYSNATSTCVGATGRYTFKSGIKDYTAFFSATTALPNQNLSLITADGAYSYNGPTLNLSAAGTVARKVIINAPNSTVYINSDLSTNYSNANKSSQIVIIAKNIFIDQSVSNVDAWLLASDIIDTCTVGGARQTQLTVDDCGTQLTVNGPVVANKLYLNRTAGSDPGDMDGTPAEIFNLRPDAYLWMYGNSAGDNRWRTTYVTELPPRL